MNKGMQKKKAAHKPNPSKTHAAPAEAGGSSIFSALQLLLIAFLGILIYSNSFDCSFHLDDRNSIIENSAIRDLSDVGAIWKYFPTRFIPYLTLAFNYQLNGLDVQGYHAVNLAIHIINAFLVWWLTALLFRTPNGKQSPLASRQRTIAFIVALLFVSHPLATQSVTYIVQRLASLATLFYLLSLCLYVKARLSETNARQKYGLFAGAFLAALLGLLSKENAYTLPFAIVLAELFFLRTEKPSAYLKDVRLLLLVAGIALAVFALYRGFLSTSGSGIGSGGNAGNTSSVFSPIPPSGGTPYTVTPTNYLMTQFRVIVNYLQLLAFPTGLNLDHDIRPSEQLFDAGTLLSLVFLLALLALAIYVFPKNRFISFGIFWFFLTLAVESSIIPISDLMFEHRTYLPSFGFFLLITAGIFQVLYTKSGALTYALFTFIIGLNSLLTFQRNKVWKDELSLWNDVVSKSPEKARPYLNRGVAYWTAGQTAKAVSDYRKAISLNPEHYASAYFNLAVAEAAMGQADQAIEHYTKAIAISPDYAIAYDGRGVVYGNRKEWDKALQDFSEAIRVSPGFAKAYYNRGSLYSARSQWKEAISDYTKAVELDPKYTDAYCNRGVAYANIGEWDLSISDCTASIRIDPRYVKAYFNRGTTFLNRGNPGAAAADFSSVLQYTPGNVLATYNRGLAYLQLKQWDNAIKDFTRTLQLDPGNQNAYTNREFAKSQLAVGAK